MMVGTTRKSSPLDRMWTNLVTCGVSRDDDDAMHTQKEGGNSKQPKENMALAENTEEAAQSRLPSDDTVTTTTEVTTTSCHNEHHLPETQTSNSKWKRLRRMLRIPKSRKRKHPTNGQVIKFRNGRTITVPDIVITAPEDEEEEEEVEEGGKGEGEEELKDNMAAKVADPIQTVDIETTLEE